MAGRVTAWKWHFHEPGSSPAVTCILSSAYLQASPGASLLLCPHPPSPGRHPSSPQTHWGPDRARAAPQGAQLQPIERPRHPGGAPAPARGCPPLLGDLHGGHSPSRAWRAGLPAGSPRGRGAQKPASSPLLRAQTQPGARGDPRTRPPGSGAAAGSHTQIRQGPVLSSASRSQDFI